MRAIIARINGVFEDPALALFGPLSTDTMADVLAIANGSMPVLARAKVEPSGDPFEVTIWFEASVTHQATVTVSATDYRAAAAKVAKMADDGTIQFEAAGSDNGPYGFEVKEPGGRIFSWEDGEEPTRE